MTKWYQLLNRIKFATPTRAVIARVALDQLVLTPGRYLDFFKSICDLLLSVMISRGDILLRIDERTGRKAARGR
ncbi:hypothetical protein C0991_003403 [Blastosporella zonata]|nr:hypothetical protein C0991_003403 [Blastosporella zonata]